MKPVRIHMAWHDGNINWTPPTHLDVRRIVAPAARRAGWNSTWLADWAWRVAREVLWINT